MKNRTIIGSIDAHKATMFQEDMTAIMIRRTFDSEPSRDCSTLWNTHRKALVFRRFIILIHFYEEFSLVLTI